MFLEEENKHRKIVAYYARIFDIPKVIEKIITYKTLCLYYCDYMKMVNMDDNNIEMVSLEYILFLKKCKKTFNWINYIDNIKNIPSNMINMCLQWSDPLNGTINVKNICVLIRMIVTQRNFSDHHIEKILVLTEKKNINWYDILFTFHSEIPYEHLINCSKYIIQYKFPKIENYLKPYKDVSRFLSIYHPQFQSTNLKVGKKASKKGNRKVSKKGGKKASKKGGKKKNKER